MLKYFYDRRADSGQSMYDLVDSHLSALASRVAHAISEKTKAHLTSFKSNGTSVEATVISRAGDVLHHFNIHLSVDDHLNVHGRLDYISTSATGEKERSKTFKFDLSAMAHPSHFAEQMIDAALEQFEGKASAPTIDMRLASMMVAL